VAVKNMSQNIYKNIYISKRLEFVEEDFVEMVKIKIIYYTYNNGNIT
jgi:hypothetical protein